jgi:response regulator RpfG family c-di-GMP phosphodiesterase
MPDDRSVLCVDDEVNVLSALQRLLRREEFRFLTAANGDEGLAVLERQPVQVVIADQRMPGMTGVEFLKRVKERYPDTVRVVLSGTADVNVVLESINQGEIYRFVTKPWNDDELRVIIRQCLAQHELVVKNRNLVELVRAQIRELQRVNARLETAIAERTQSLRYSRAVLKRLPVPVIGVNVEGRLILANEAAVELIPALRDLPPNAEVAAALPPALGDLLERCRAGHYPPKPPGVHLDGRGMSAHVLDVDDPDTAGGCVLVLV